MGGGQAALSILFSLWLNLLTLTRQDRGPLCCCMQCQHPLQKALTRNAAVTAGPRGGVCGGIRWKLSAESWFFSGPGRIVDSRGSMAEG